MTEEGVPSLGRDGSTYQEYIVPAFLTQVDQIDTVAVVHEVVDVEETDEVGNLQVIYFLAMSLTSESFISERAQVQCII